MEETPPTPSPPSGEDCALLRSFLLSPRGRPRGGPSFPWKKLRALRPRLTARTALCSVPSSSPHAAGRAGAPVFLPEENETAPAGACRRPTAAKRRLLGRRQTGRARSKREKKHGDAAGARLNERRNRNGFPRAIELSGSCPMTNGPASLFAAAPRPLLQFPVYCSLLSLRRISGSGKRRWSIRRAPNPRSNYAAGRRLA